MAFIGAVCPAPFQARMSLREMCWGRRGEKESLRLLIAKALELERSHLQILKEMTKATTEALAELSLVQRKPRSEDWGELAWSVTQAVASS